MTLPLFPPKLPKVPETVPQNVVLAELVTISRVKVVPEILVLLMELNIPVESVMPREKSEP